MSDFAQARSNMVESQIRTNKVTDQRILDAFLDVPREQFVPKSSRGIAYVDEDISVGGGRYLMEPMVLARLIQALNVRSSDLVLDVACATGYSSAILARLANTVVALEEDSDLASSATAALAELDVDNAVVVEGRLVDGYPSQGPYQAILINGSVAEVPAAFAEQLTEGGRLAAVLSDDGRMGNAVLMTKLGGHLAPRVLFDAAIPTAPGFERAASFVF
ncbi:MAG: protein-L-isoaspartate O-methyltransferase [Pseudomonadota bacterium]